ncbi:dihydroorotate dehydrogenase [Chloroflexota bacterium]
MPVDLSVNLAPNHTHGLILANPVMTASGTFGYGEEYQQIFDIQKLGGIVCKGTMYDPRDGNPQPRLTETPCGMLNSVGLQGIGVKALIKEKAPLWAGWRVPVIVNIAGNTAEEYGRVAAKLNGVPGVAALEVNISCPNIRKGGAEFGLKPESAAEVTAIVRQATTLPIIVKLTPNSTNIRAVAAAVETAGADAVTVINTLKGMSIDVKRCLPLLGTITGGLSGPAIKPVALRMVYEVAGAVSIPVIGCGGIATTQDALEFVMAGASAVQVGTAMWTNEKAPLEIIEGLEDYLDKEGIASLSKIIGAARR